MATSPKSWIKDHLLFILLFPDLPVCIKNSNTNKRYASFCKCFCRKCHKQNNAEFGYLSITFSLISSANEENIGEFNSRGDWRYSLRYWNKPYCSFTSPMRSVNGTSPILLHISTTFFLAASTSKRWNKRICARKPI